MHVVSLLVLSFVGLAWTQSSTIDDYLASESPIAKAGLLANIGPSGSKSSGAKSGIVIASPSTTNPNYLYTWTRDAALTLKAIVDQYTGGEDTSLRSTIDSYVTAQQVLQQVSNPSGTVSTGGLAEPKFNIDGTAFTGSWGRPQRDGPALRSTALITWANYLISEGNSSYVIDTLWPIIDGDLNYVANYWNETGFDLWEEINSSSFFTTAVQHRALREGAALAAKLSNDASVFNTQAGNVLCFLQSYWNSGSGYITANTGGGRSGKDSNTVLGSIHTFDEAAGCDATTFQPCSDKALSNLKVYVDSFRSIYGINSGVPSNQGVAVGRYPEDVYFNGNPWYLSTLAVAEQLYDSLIVWNKQGSITVTSTSQPFFSTFVSNIATGTYTSGSSTFSTLTTSIKSFADEFVAFVAKYTPSGGGLGEQFDRNTGTPTSAVDLTWTYASLLTAVGARNGIVSANWGASGLQIPPVCNTAPDPIPFTFHEDATTQLGENIFVTGNLRELGNWDPSKAVPLDANSYPIWNATVNLPKSITFQYKYIRIFNGQVTWESDPNRQSTTPGSGSFVENDSWR
ncbi:carbohydrate-binding module family 20 protein [Amanita muscaria Koide BX008]|uniref:glucan 1,4-alpha-glucosidase n=1 Tax=Amanita muscaria (strain Koide BX008) TaxID=946122 RepID=A0A0C2XAN4_AMAMK|nr:carbohydrate-binding module family 20 protein [Amanita muscaria Koide BX008]